MTPDSLRALLSDAYEAGTFNGAVVICRNGDVEFEEYYGVESASGDTLTRTSAFRLASLSKAYTAAGVLRLCEQGKLDLDGPVQGVMPDFPYADVTPRHLLNHTSGIGDLYLELATVTRTAWAQSFPSMRWWAWSMPTSCPNERQATPWCTAIRGMCLQPG